MAPADHDGAQDQLRQSSELAAQGVVGLPSPQSATARHAIDATRLTFGLPRLRPTVPYALTTCSGCIIFSDPASASMRGHNSPRIRWRTR